MINSGLFKHLKQTKDLISTLSFVRHRVKHRLRLSSLMAVWRNVNTPDNIPEFLKETESMLPRPLLSVKQITRRKHMLLSLITCNKI